MLALMLFFSHQRILCSWASTGADTIPASQIGSKTPFEMSPVLVQSVSDMLDSIAAVHGNGSGAD